MNEFFKHVATAVATTALLGILAYAGGLFQKGMDADSAEKMKTVLQEEMKAVINGETKTFAEALSVLSDNDVKMAEQLDGISTEVGSLRDDVWTLAGGD
jgi:hypothetical protein